MNLNNYPSKLLEQAVNEFSKFPGIGQKTALRLVMFLLKQNNEEVNHFGETIIRLKNELKQCIDCNSISDNERCIICSNDNRDSSLICVVENTKDVMAIENTRQFNGKYHVLGGIISPIDGIGPSDIEIDSLEKKIDAGNIREIILALSTTMEGDTTNFYIFKRIKKYNIKVSTIARGVAIGDELEYTDEVTLGRSIVNRTIFEVNV